MFKVDGSIDVQIVDAYVAEPKFPPKPEEVGVVVYYDVCLVLKDDQGNTDTWKGEISNRTGSGNRAHMMRSDLTLETLREIGFNMNTIAELEAQFAPDQNGNIILPNLINMNLRCTATVVESDKKDQNGKSYYNVRYLNKLGGGTKRLSFTAFQQRQSAPMNSAPMTAAPAPQGYAPQGYAPQGYAPQPQYQAAQVPGYAAPGVASPAPTAAPAPAAAPVPATPPCPY